MYNSNKKSECDLLPHFYPSEEEHIANSSTKELELIADIKEVFSSNNESPLIIEHTKSTIILKKKLKGINPTFMGNPLFKSVK